MMADVQPRSSLTSMRSLVDMALFCVEDGAFYTGAKRLREAADALEKHARKCDRDLDEGNDK